MTKQQEHARARRRKEARRGTQQVISESAKDKRLFGAILAVILVVAAAIAIPHFLPDSDAAPAAAPTPAAATTAALEEGQRLAAGCEQPPTLQTTPKTFATVPDKKTAAGRTFVATVTTTCGDLTFELDGTKAPQTVASFVFLAERGYWAPSPCHRVTSAGIFVLQCGDPTGTGSGDPGYGFGVENAPKDGVYPAGTLAMARTSDPNSNGGQFFITYKKTTLPTKGGGYTIFGTVTDGLDIVKKIASHKALPPNQNDGTPVSPISILSVKVTEKKA
ncbi:MAG: peptidylprolyl isomerase [Intrasporangium sp.]|uniref:peptidylprolyl isomerase n=1 Tax=Intrasporangium sp. TaxID=1925024 RepID=UPI002648EE38|nr:peptidylprolyl isomerase [Intrasporangium sp.]MDN5794616.1 peptidylprolyl isomerase [Intrasporangium sp.]